MKKCFTEIKFGGEGCAGMTNTPLEKSICFSSEKIKNGITLEDVPCSEPKAESIPEALRALPHWVLWGVQRRGEKITKPPLYVCDGRLFFSSVDAPNKWHSFPETLQALAQWRGKSVSLGDGAPLTVAGVGFVLTDDITGVDIDHCTDSEGTIYEWASPLVKALKLAGYVERSPSGTGIRAFTREPLPAEYAEGGHPEGFKWNDGTRGIEVYRGRRYLTVTGRKLEGANPEPIRGDMCAPALSLLWKYYAHKQTSRPQRGEVKTAPRGVHLDDDVLLQKAFAAKNGAEIKALYYTPPREGEDASVEDQRLASYLAFWAGGDAATLDRLMRGSARLQREDRLQKWDSRHAANGQTYGQMTIEKAISSCARFYAPSYSKERGRTDTEEEGGDALKAATLSRLPEVPRGIFPEAVEEAIQDIADKMAGGLYSVALSGALAGIVGAVRGKRSIAVFQSNPQPGILWLCNIAPSGSGKTGAIAPWENYLTRDNIQKQNAYDKKYREYKRNLQLWKNTPKKEREEAPEEPAYPPKSLMEDTTLEALGDNLKRFYTSGKTPCTTLFCDELRQGLRSLDCYSGGKAGVALPQLLSRYDMAKWDNTRLTDKGRDFTLPRAGASIYGGLQTSLIPDVFSLDMINSGGFGRWAFFLSEAPEHKRTQREPLMKSTTQTVAQIMDYLIRLPEAGEGGGIIQITPEAGECFDSWYEALYDSAFAEGRTDFVDKFSKLASRLALIIHLVNMAVSDNPTEEVTLDTMQRALRLTEYFRQTQGRVLAYALGRGASVQPRERTAARILLSHMPEIAAAGGRVPSSILLGWLKAGGLAISPRTFGSLCKALSLGGAQRTEKERYREISEVAITYMKAITDIS